MTIKQQINDEAICHMHNDISHFIHQCHTLATLSPPLCYQKYRMIKIKICSIYGCFRISHYIKGRRKSNKIALTL